LLEPSPHQLRKTLLGVGILICQHLNVERSYRKNLDHEPPHWVQEASVYFITVCAESRGINHFCHSELGADILDSVHFRNEKGIWFCHLALLMPDHIHLLMSFPDIPSFSRKIGDWKHYLSHRYDIVWQENFFDHRLRNGESLGQKSEYILDNPVRAGLIAEAKDWPYIYIPGR